MVSEEPIQMLYIRSNHHLLSFNSNKRIQVCVWMPKRCNDEIFEDSLRISPRQKKKVTVTIIPVQKTEKF